LTALSRSDRLITNIQALPQSRAFWIGRWRKHFYQMPPRPSEGVRGLFFKFFPNPLTPPRYLLIIPLPLHRNGKRNSERHLKP
jgi:hypothetical protein